MTEPKGMTGNEYHRHWEESELEIRELELEIARVGVALARIRSVNRRLYEGALKRPAPEYLPAPSARQRAS